LKSGFPNGVTQGATVVQTLREFELEKEKKTGKNKELREGAKKFAGAKNVSTLLRSKVYTLMLHRG
jgi:hypothetical protein